MGAFIQWLISEISLSWSQTAPLPLFSGAIEISLAINFAYSVLLKLGKFSGSRVDQWVDDEKLRVMPPLSENEHSSEKKFTREINSIRDNFKLAISIMNVFLIAWAIAASTVDAILLLIIPFLDKMTVHGFQVFHFALYLYGAIPLGLFLHAVFHLFALIRMKRHSSQYDTVIRLLSNVPAEKITAARAALQAKLKAERLERSAGA